MRKSFLMIKRRPLPSSLPAMTEARYRLFENPATCNRSSRDVLASEDFQRLLQRLYLLLPPGNAILEADTSVHARRLQFIEVSEGGIELFLSPLEVLIIGGQRMFLILLLRGFVLDVCLLLLFVNRRVGHELIILLLSRGLRRLRVGLKTGKVTRDHLKHANHTSVLRLHTLVRRVHNLWDLRLLLQQRCRISCFRIEILQN